MAPAPRKKDETGELSIPIEKYIEARDHVIGSLHNLQAGLAHVQNGITELVRSYLNYSNSVLVGEDGEMQLSKDVAAVAASAMELGRNAADASKHVVASVDKAVEMNKGQKRKRAKKEKDPNAPKKPLTAAFLYHQHARPIVKADLEAALAPGAQIEKNAVQLEVNKRWNELPDEEKEQWKASYRNSMEEYKVSLAEYVKNKGIKAADLIEEDEGSDEGEPEIEAEAGTADSDASSEEEDEAPVKAPSPPAKTPRKRQKTAPAVNGTANSVPVPIAPAVASTPIPLPNARAATQVPAPATAVVVETPAKKDKKKKEKAGAQNLVPVPTSSHDEPSPEETGGKKKSKSSRSTRNNEVDGDKENAAAAEKAEKAGKEKKRDRSKRKSEAASS